MKAVQQQSDAVSAAVEKLKVAGKYFTVNSIEVFESLRTLEAAKLDPAGWSEIVGGQESPGHRWQLVFTTGTAKVREAMKGKGKGMKMRLCLIE